MGDSARPHWPPYIAGVVLGLVLILTFILVGNGVGASGMFARFAAVIGDGIAPQITESNAYLGPMLRNGSNPLLSWIVFEVIGIALGALLAAVASGRFRFKFEGTHKIGHSPRLILALSGGVLAGIGSRIASGCTSGIGLSGAAMLGVGGFVFLVTFFVVGLGVSRLMKGAW
jgi:uncharacterized protein